MKLEEVIFSGTTIFGCDVNMELLVNAHAILRLAYSLGLICWFKFSLFSFFKPSFGNLSFVPQSMVIPHAMTSICYIDIAAY